MPIDPSLASLLSQLGMLAAANTSAEVTTKIRASKAAGKHEETVRELQDIIDHLIDERSQLLQISMALRDQFVAESLDEADIQYITDTLIPAVEELLELDSGADGEQRSQTVAILRKIASREMLTILQLVGFNYRGAIGEPLTRLVEYMITKDLPTPETPRLQAAFFEREAAIAKVALNAKAVTHFERLRPIEE